MKAARWQSCLVLCAIVAAAATLAAQAPVTPEEFARRQYDSGLEFLRSGRYAEALKDFQAVVESYPATTIADEAQLAMARYQLDVARDAGAAQTIAESLLKKFPTSDSVPMAYVVIGQAMVARGITPANTDAALANFERVPRLFPGSDAVAPAVYAAGDTLKRLGRCADALQRFEQVETQYPRTAWAWESRLSSAGCLVAAGRPVDAMSTLQAVTDADATTPQARLARAWNTILYRLYLKAPARQAYTLSERSVGGPAGKLKDVAAVALGDRGTDGCKTTGTQPCVYVGTRAGVMVLDERGTPLRTFGSGEVRGLFVDAHGRVVMVQRAVLQQEDGSGAPGLVTLTAPRDNGPQKVLDDLSAVAMLSTGDRLVADRSVRAVYRFDAAGKFAAPFASVRASRIAVGPGDVVALLDRDTKSISIVDRDGKPAARIMTKGTGYELRNPTDIAFDALGHLYVLERDGVDVFTAAGTLVTAFAPPAAAQGSGGFRDASAFALDEAARLYVYDERTERVQIYQ
jgi:TolA-binding protein